MPSNYAVAARLEEMDRLYLRCLDLTRAFLEMDPLPLDKRLEHFIRDRAELLTGIKDLEQALPTRREGEKNIIDVDDPVIREQLEPLINSLRDRLTALLEADRRLGEKIREAVVRTRDDLQRVRLGQAILKAYTPASMRPVYLDRRG